MSTTKATLHWLCSGREMFPAMVDAIGAAKKSIRLETYTMTDCALAAGFRDALLDACRRGVRVRVLVDAFGSYRLPSDFFQPLTEAGGDVRWFNPITLERFSIRNHRKLLVCDESVAFVGGFNITEDYDGDGVTCGWCDVGVKLAGALGGVLAASFDEMFGLAEFKHRRFMRLRRFIAKKTVATQTEELLLSGPGRGASPIKRSLRRDIGRAQNIRIIVAYFLPTWRLRRALMRAARRGATVQLLLAGKTDVQLSQLAGRSLYRRLLRAGVEIYEYQPQILHAKLMILDDAVYIGSANLDVRSLSINYELMLRFDDAATAKQANEVFDRNLKNSVRIQRESWSDSRTMWRRLKQRWAYFLLARIDPYVSLRQWRALKD